MLVHLKPQGPFNAAQGWCHHVHPDAQRAFQALGPRQTVALSPGSSINNRSRPFGSCQCYVLTARVQVAQADGALPFMPTPSSPSTSQAAQLVPPTCAWPPQVAPQGL